MPADALRRVFAAQLKSVGDWVSSQPNFSRLDVNYNRVLANPAAEAARVGAFLGVPERAGDMAAAVDKSLYRNRK
jgi:hypothetical protein